MEVQGANTSECIDIVSIIGLIVRYVAIAIMRRRTMHHSTTLQS
jgi:hypothetical protein